MAGNWRIEARGLLFWSETTRTVDFDGDSYSVEFAELLPEQFSDDRVKSIDDHTAEITVEDPNGLV